MRVRLYPTVPAARRRTILLDVATVVGVLVFAWAGMKVHDAVAELAALGRGVQDAGAAVQRTGSDVGGAITGAFEGAGGAVGGAPLVGGTLEDALRDAGSDAGGAITGAGRDSGGRVVAAGREGEARAYRLANLLGWGTFLLTTLWLLSRAVPPRVRAVRAWTAADRVFAPSSEISAHGAEDPGLADRRAAVLAQRAVASLDYRDLLRHTTDPVGDLLAGRHDGLLAALAEHDGVDARPLVSR